VWLNSRTGAEEAQVLEVDVRVEAAASVAEMIRYPRKVWPPRHSNPIDARERYVTQGKTEPDVGVDAAAAPEEAALDAACRAYAGLTEEEWAIYCRAFPTIIAKRREQMRRAVGAWRAATAARAGRPTPP
jgi:hypothetical protein